MPGRVIGRQGTMVPLLMLSLIALFTWGCSSNAPNRMKFIKEGVVLDGRIQSGDVRYSSLNLSDLKRFPHIGIELPDSEVIRLSEVNPDWLLDHSTDVEWRGGTGVPSDGLHTDVMYHFYLDRRAYRFGVRNGAIINFGMNPAPLGLGLKEGVLWDMVEGKRFAMPLSPQEAANLFGPPDRTETYRFDMK